MKNSTLLAALAASALVATGLGATSAQAAPATASTNARARVLKQLTITRVADLNFGTIVSGASASTVVIADDGTRAPCVGITCTGATSAAAFDVTGSNSTVVTVTTPGTVTLANTTTPGPTMTATLSAPATMTLNNSGVSPTPLVFGGTLNVGAAQADGAYEVLFDVTVNYQ